MKENQPDLSRTVAERILSLKEPAENWSQFADRVGLTPALVSNYLKGQHGAGLKAVASLAANGFDPRWLLTGEGPQEYRDPSEAETRLAAVRRVLEATVPEGEGTDRLSALLRDLAHDAG